MRKGVQLAVILSASFVMSEETIPPVTNVVRFVHVTPAYSNAVLRALLPEFNNFADRLKDEIAGMPRPITPEMVKSFKPNPTAGYIGGWLVLTNDFQFWFG